MAKLDNFEFYKKLLSHKYFTLATHRPHLIRAKTLVQVKQLGQTLALQYNTILYHAYCLVINIQHKQKYHVKFPTIPFVLYTIFLSVG